MPEPLQDLMLPPYFHRGEPPVILLGKLKNVWNPTAPRGAVVSGPILQILWFQTDPCRVP